MPLSNLVEFIASYRERGSRGPLLSNTIVRQETIQVNGQLAGLQTIPINTTISQADHSFIIYRHNFGPAMVPNAFNARVVYAGNTIFNGLLTAVSLARDYDSFIIGLRQMSYQVVLQNMTGLLQNYEYTISFLAIPGESEYAQVLEILKRYHQQGGL